MSGEVEGGEPSHLTAGRAFDCQQCGACCHAHQGWVDIAAADDARIDASVILRALVVVSGAGSAARHSLRMIDGVCGAFAPTATGVTCTAYDHRPEVCRALEAGSPGCLAARARRGMD